MIKHLFTLVWNRKRINIPIIIEIFLSFLVLAFIVTRGVHLADKYRQPLGYAYEDVWYISLTSNRFPWTEEDSTAIKQIYQAFRDFEEIQAVGATSAVPFSASYWSTNLTSNGRQAYALCSIVTDDLKEVLGLEIVHGRWFEETDDALNWEPVVINQKLSQELFGAEDPLGKKIEFYKDSTEYRIVGVISDYRYTGMFEEPFNFMFKRLNWKRPFATQRYYDLPTSWLIKVHRGTLAAFEEKLMKKFQAIAKDWTFGIQPLSRMRTSLIKRYLTPLTVLGIVAAFLLIMVGLGLVGVLWQNVTQRTKEIGLRRANGATAMKIYAQILGELLVITSIGIAIGTAVVIQFFPLLDMLKLASWKVYLSGLAISGLLMYGLVILCGLYPSWLATRVHPAEALHYE